MTDDRVMGLLYAFDDSVEAGMAALRRNPDLLHARTSLGETPLHFLCVENRLDAVRGLVQTGAAVDTVNDLGTTPLSDAATAAKGQASKASRRPRAPQTHTLICDVC